MSRGHVLNEKKWISCKTIMNNSNCLVDVDMDFKSRKHSMQKASFSPIEQLPITISHGVRGNCSVDIMKANTFHVGIFPL